MAGFHGAGSDVVDEFQGVSVEPCRIGRTAIAEKRLAVIDQAANGTTGRVTVDRIARAGSMISVHDGQGT